MNVIYVNFSPDYWKINQQYFNAHGEAETRKALKLAGYQPSVITPYIKRLKKGVLSEKDTRPNGHPKE